MIIHKRATGNYIANLDINLLRRQRIICVSRAREGKKRTIINTGKTASNTHSVTINLSPYATAILLRRYMIIIK